MRTILPVVAMALLCPAALAQAQTQDPAAQPAPAAAPAQPAPAAPAPAPQAAPALQVNPPEASAPDNPPSGKTSKPAKKSVAKRGRSWQSDEARARGIAARYGVSW
jgi:2-oxoglutarate dehydrogenase E2 component (dihydrolipoamide succinyltransferase)